MPREMDCERQAHMAETDDADADIGQGRRVHRSSTRHGKPYIPASQTLKG